MMESSSQPSADASEQLSGLKEEKPVDPMEDFSRQLEDIINTYGSACSLVEEKISILEKDEEKVEVGLDANSEASSSPETEQTASMILEGLGKEHDLSFSLFVLGLRLACKMLFLCPVAWIINFHRG